MKETDWIALVGVFIALGTLVVQQWQLIVADRRNEARTANKLKILYLCQNAALTERDIIEQYRGAERTKSVDDVEIRKAIYEMLTDNTLIYTANKGAYEVPVFSSAQSLPVQPALAQQEKGFGKPNAEEERQQQQQQQQ